MTRERAVALLGYGLFVVVLGVPDGGIGVLWPSMRHSLDRPLADLGLLVFVGAACYVATSAVTGWVVTRFGVSRTVLLAVAVSTLAFAGWSVASLWGLVLLLVGLLGLARGWIDSGINAYTAHVGTVGQMGVLHAMYGLGATLAPLLVTAALVLGVGWRPVIGLFALLSGCLLVGAVRIRRAWSPLVVDAGNANDELQPLAPARVAVPASLVVFFCYTAVEVATGAWAFVLLTDGRGLDRGVAGVAVASYWAALTGGRLLLGWRGDRVAAPLILRASWAVALGGLLLLWVAPTPLAPFGLPIEGLGLAAIFPVLVALTPARVGPDRAPKAIGLSIAAAALGGPALTALAGAVASAYGVEAIAVVLVAAGGALAASEIALARVAPVPSA
ncbi:MAG TPA: MFS transporter [Acidimicrobiia bacterium]